MLVENTIIIKGSKGNAKWIKNLGMEWELNKKFEIKIEDIPKNSTIKIPVFCDYCLKEGIENIIYKSYDKYLRGRNRFPKDCCEKCIPKKMEEQRMSKAKSLTRQDRGYWKIKENRINELHAHIKKYNTIDNMRKTENGRALENVILRYDKDVFALAVEIGYDIKDISKFRKQPRNYYHNVENINKEILKYKDTFGIVPSYEQVRTEIHINPRYLNMFGGYNKILKDIGLDINKLIDLKGELNDSFGEMIVANYLILNDIPYTRRHYPFPKNERRYKSDFTFYLNDGQMIECEVWGCQEKDRYRDTDFIEHYLEVRKAKTELYKKYNIKLIEIEYEVFNREYKGIQEQLYNIFSPYFKHEFKVVDYDVLTLNSQITDEIILENIMKHSKDKNALPPIESLESDYKYYTIILQRHGSYKKFGEKFNKLLCKENTMITKEKIFIMFEYMINKYGKILEYVEVRNLNDDKLRGYTNIRGVFGSSITAKIDFFEYAIKNNIKLSEHELKTIKQYAGVLPYKTIRFLKDDHISKAQNLLLSLQLAS